MPIYLLAAAALCLIALAAWLLEWKPIDAWRRLLRRWSLWLHGTGFLNLAAYLGVWNMMPLEMQKFVHPQIFLWVGIVLWLAAAIATYVKQEKLHGE